MTTDLIQLAQDQLDEAAALHSKLAADTTTGELLARWAITIADAFERGGTIFFAGNGGSFADAQHMAAEFTGKMGRIRRPLSAIALGTNNSSFSAVGNDFGWREVFSRDLLALSRPQSVFIAISTSGNSENILTAVETAKTLSIPVLGLTGATASKLSATSECFRAPSERTERIQELHTLFLHTLCLLVEAELSRRNLI